MRFIISTKKLIDWIICHQKLIRKILVNNKKENGSYVEMNFRTGISFKNARFLKSMI